MPLLLAALTSTALATVPFAGAELRFVGEFDGGEYPAEGLVNLGVRPLQVKKNGLTLVWFPSELSWGIAPPVERLDHLETTALEGRQVFGSEKAAATWELGGLLYDQDSDVLDLTFAGGGVDVVLVPKLMRLQLGGDLRLRVLDTRIQRIFDDTPSEQALLLGVPVSLNVFQDKIKNNLYASGELWARPAVGLAGTEPFALDGGLNAEGGLELVDEKEINVRLFVAYAGKIDTFTALPYAGMQHQIGIGGRAKF